MPSHSRPSSQCVFYFQRTHPCSVLRLAPCTRRKDVVGIAETGSGKTLALAFPARPDPLLRQCREGPRALVLAPTRSSRSRRMTHLSAEGRAIAPLHLEASTSLSRRASIKGAQVVSWHHLDAPGLISDGGSFLGLLDYSFRRGRSYAGQGFRERHSRDHRAYETGCLRARP